MKTAALNTAEHFINRYALVVYSENRPTSRQILTLLLLFPIIYLTNLGVRELDSQEALQASIAAGIASGETFLATQVQGQPVQSLPGYPWLVALASGFQRPNEWTTRFPAALAILGMALLAGALTASQVGRKGAAVTTAMVLTTLLCMQEGVTAAGDTVFAFFIAAAWISWYWVGQEKRHWGLAWAVSLPLVLAATFTSGVHALAYFYFPLVFLRRPLKGWRRILLPAHLLLFILVAALLAIWYIWVPQQTLMPWNTLALRNVGGTTGSYFRNLITFPFINATLLLPWTFLAWPAFCQAYRSVEKNNPLFHYLRTIVISIFITAWLLPMISYRMLLPLISPLAILTGLHYEILMRRMFISVEKFYQVLFWTIATVAGGCLGLAILHLLRLVIAVNLSTAIFVNNLALLMVVAITIWMLYKHAGRWALWMRLAVLVASARLVWLAMVPPLQAWLYSENRRIGDLLRQDIPTHATVYKTVDWFLVTECYYMKREVRKIIDVETDIPRHAPVVYVLSGARPPIQPARSWISAGPPVDLRMSMRPHFDWFPGGITILNITPVMHTSDTEPPVIVRVYQGTLR